MIKIKILDEARFNDDANLTDHHIKHVLTKRDGAEQMDAMSKDTLDDLADALTTSKCGDLDDSDDVVGYVSAGGRYSKFDKTSHISAVYNNDKNKTITVFKTTLDKFTNKAKGNGEHKKVADIPDAEKEKGKSFDYNIFSAFHDIVPRRKINEVERTMSSAGIAFDDYSAEEIVDAFFPEDFYNKQTNKIGKAKVKEKFYLKLFKIQDADKLAIDCRFDKDKGDPVDNVALLLTNYVGKEATVKLSGIYNSEDIKALIFSIPDGSPLKKITTVGSLVMTVAKTSKGKESMIKQDEVYTVPGDILFTGTICYVNNNSTECHASV